MRNSLSDRASARVLKLILFFLVLAAASACRTRDPFARFLAVPHAAWFASALAYLLVSISVLVMRVCHKAAAAAACFFAPYLLIFYFLDDIQAYVPFLTPARIIRIVCLAALILMIRDIYSVARELVQPRIRKQEDPERHRQRLQRFKPDRKKHHAAETGPEGEEIQELRYALSLLLESRWGRTPTEEEVTEYAKNIYENRQ